MKRISQLILIPAMATLFTACDHKELCLDHSHTVNARITFDWRNAPDADPSSMAAYLFDIDNSGAEPLRYIFSGRDGGNVHMPAGQYSALGMNSDNNDWAFLRNINDIETFEIYTGDATLLSSFGLSTLNVPRARDTENERIAETPGTVYSDRRDNEIFHVNDTVRNITLYPEEITCHYTVTVLDVENIDYLNGGSLDATLSGLAEGFLHGKNAATSTPVTMPFNMSADKDAATLKGRFLTFGEPSNLSVKHILTIYIVFSDESRRYYTFDVTDQVHDAPDPHNVDIVVTGLSIPKPIADSGGFRPDVADWEPVDVFLNM